MAVKSNPGQLALVTDLNHCRDVLRQTRDVIDKMLADITLARKQLPTILPASAVYGKNAFVSVAIDALDRAVASANFEINGRHLVDSEHQSRIADIVDPLNKK